MKNLAAHYRPQTFAEVTGQDMITTVLSRAAEQDRVATAYLLSGTRGVGKTTIARILAKALNCKNAPTPEPCNVCSNCLMITKGNHVDVTEIDGASNNSVEDARALRENIGYAPMEGRYKVFIIDEAHMLSRSAFNALLKTLEEPPPRVVFILATTEAHKFPITIVSRCQHFIFKRLSEEGLVVHLSKVLNTEEIPFDPQAVRTIAKRAAGSVRDSMSLLAQTLALSDDKLDMESTRSVLGLAGQELFNALMDAIVKQNCPSVVQIMQKICDQGIDIGYFLRELTALWRILFLLREAGEGIIPTLNLSQEEKDLWLQVSSKFSAAHLHAAWHMTLDAMRKVIHSPEPAAALELLLLNITLMPRLLPLQALQTEDGIHTGTHSNARTNDTGNAHFKGTAQEQAHIADSQENFAQIHSKGRHEREATFAPKQMVKNVTIAQDFEQNSNSASNIHPENNFRSANIQVSEREHTFTADENLARNLSAESKIENEPENRHVQENQHTDVSTLKTEQNEQAPTISSDDTSDDLIDEQSGNMVGDKKQTEVNQGTFPSMDMILEHIANANLLPAYVLKQTSGYFEENILYLQTESQMARVKVQDKLSSLQQLLQPLCPSSLEIQLKSPVNTHKPPHQLLEEYAKREELQICFTELGAKLYEVRPDTKK